MTKLQVDALPEQAAQMPRAYGLAMLGGERCFVADDPAELVAVIIHGYEDFDDTEAGRKAATVARLHSSIEAANIIQSSLLASAVQADTFDAEGFDEFQLTAVMGWCSSRSAAAQEAIICGERRHCLQRWDLPVDC